MVAENSDVDAGSVDATETGAEEDVTVEAGESGDGSFQESEPEGGTPEGGANEEGEAYVPNFSYAIKDQNLEFDEKLRGLITSKEIEDHLRDLHTQAGGLPGVKESRDQLQTKYTDLDGKYSQQTEALQHLSGYVQKNDLDSFFEALQIPQEAVLRWALAHAERTPEQAQAANAQRQTQQQAYWAQQQNQALQNNVRQMNAQMRAQSMDMVLYKPEVTNVAKAFDERVGRPGAFREECVRRDAMNVAMRRQTTPDQVVSEMISLVGMAATPTATATPVAAVNKLVVPNIRAGSKSPTARTYNSVEDLRARAKELGAG